MTAKVRTIAFLLSWSLLCTACGESESHPDNNVNAAPAERRILPLLDYVDLETDALTSDKIDWRDAMEIARLHLLEVTNGAEEYQLIAPPATWYNADESVMMHVWYRKDDTEILLKPPPNRGFLVVLDADTGAIIASGVYNR